MTVTHRYRWACVLALPLLLLCAAARAADSGNASAGADDRGARIFAEHGCAGCHGTDGKKITTGPSLGSVANNPYEMLHKVMNGQPAEAMPSLRALDPQVSVDIVVHLQTLPK